MRILLTRSSEGNIHKQNEGYSYNAFYQQRILTVLSADKNEAEPDRKGELPARLGKT
jgi:hypothetical protein